ncbi:MAG TPA: hypothetical protein VGN88_00475 [Phycisphaerae bacterium]|jgi:hypothetical protein
MLNGRGAVVVVLLMAIGGAGCEHEASGPGATVPAASMPVTTEAARSAAAVISGGHETEGQDRGRPDILVAAGLGVPTEVFREAFSHVKPAPAGQQPDPQQVQLNKKALMDALGKYGVSNDRLDEVSNYYRYPPGDPKLWKHTEAAVKATVVNGKVVGFVVESGGAGYTTLPVVKVPGFEGLKVKVTLWYGKDLARNGSVEKVELSE